MEVLGPGVRCQAGQRVHGKVVWTGLILAGDRPPHKLPLPTPYTHALDLLKVMRVIEVAVDRRKQAELALPHAALKKGVKGGGNTFSGYGMGETTVGSLPHATLYGRGIEDEGAERARMGRYRYRLNGN